MIIEKNESTAQIGAFIEAEQERYEAENQIVCEYAPFCFSARIGGEIAGAVSGASFFSEIYLDELVVRKEYRGKGIGRALLKAVEQHFEGQGFENINCCTNGFQSPDFYTKCGFELEFVRENKKDPKLNKYYFVKYLGEKEK